ncbi:hypothetical protein Cni_G29039 [Canna indica]|uniref:Uncharacterized protein n=1 Tax=Canna indica TaxID=4628 RepID=A0AAQ3QTL9_9LILI|nr:hypothetical protein Cni_G29039 [Canna indica]
MANPILKTMCKKEEQYEEGLIGPIEMDVSSITEKSEHQQLPMDRLWKRGSRRRRLREQLASKPLLLQNRHRLGNLLDRLVRAHNWKEASGVLSVLLKGTPQCGNLLEARRDFLIAMEIQRRLGGEGGFYPTKIKKTYEVLMSKLSWTKKSSAKRYSIQLELALFYISLGNIQEALNTTKFLVQDHDAASEPTVNLLHGMLLYETWYSSLPEDMKIKGFDTCMLSEASDATLTDGFEEPEAFASSNGHIAIDIEDANNSSNLGSESSIGNGKNIIDLKDEVKQQNNGAPHATELYSSASEMNDDRPLNPHHHLGCSIFLAHGLEKDLLPARLDHLSGDLEDIIYSYRRLTNEHYDDAVKHLRQALHSSPPLLVAMLPLVQDVLFS